MNLRGGLALAASTNTHAPGRARALRTGPDLVGRRRLCGGHGGVGGNRSRIQAWVTLLLYNRVLSYTAIMVRTIVALACAAGVSAFLAPSAPAPAKTVVFGKGGELRDRKQQRPHASAAP